jgi:SAM-dependent methyltransferase
MWDQRYGEPGYAYGTDPNSFLAVYADQIPSGRVLCLAEGQGRNAVYLAQLGYRVTAVDSSVVGLAKARELAAQRGVRIDTVVADLASFDIEMEAWEGIVSIFCHLSPAVRSRLHRQIADGLSSGGCLILEAYTPRQLAFRSGGPPDAELTMTAEGLREELVGVRLDILREVERDVIEGKYHTGRGAVVQVLARRGG